jgi:hypothetical protein
MLEVCKRYQLGGKRNAVKEMIAVTACLIILAEAADEEQQ